MLILIPRYSNWCENNSNTTDPKMGEGVGNDTLTKYEVLMENFLHNRYCLKYIQHRESNVSFPFPARVI